MESKEKSIPKPKSFQNLLPVLIGLLYGFTTLFYRAWAVRFIEIESAFFFSLAGVVLTLIVALVFRRIKYSPISVCLWLLFLVLSIVSAVSSKNISASVIELINLFSSILLFVTIFSLQSENRHFGTSLLLTLAGLEIIVVSIDLATYLLTGGYAVNYFFSGYMGQHNRLGGILIMFIPILYLVGLNSENLKLRVFYGAGLIINLFALLLTFSQGSWVSLVITGAIYFLFLQKPAECKLSPVKIFGVGMAILALFLITFVGLVPLVSKTIDKERSLSNMGRLVVWRDSLSMFRESPIVGLGPGTFATEHSRYQSQPWMYFDDAHNSYLQILVETGLLGLAVFGFLLIRMFKHIFKTSYEPNVQLLARGVGLSLLASSLHVFVDFDWQVTSNFSFFVILLAILFALNESKVKTFNFQRSRSSVLVLLAPIIFVLFAFTQFFSEKRIQLAYDLYFEGDLSGARKFALEAKTLSPWNTKSYYPLGKIEEDLNNNIDASNYYSEVLRFNKYDKYAQVNLAILKAKDGKHDDAIAMIEEALETVPYINPTPYLQLSEIYFKKGDVDTATRVLERAIYVIFPLNDVYYWKENEIVMEVTGYKWILTEIYSKLGEMYLLSNQEDKIPALLKTIEDHLDPRHPAFLELKKNLARSLNP